MSRVRINPPAPLITGGAIRVIWDMLTDGNLQQFYMDYISAPPGNASGDIVSVLNGAQTNMAGSLAAIFCPQTTNVTTFGYSLNDYTVPTRTLSPGIVGTRTGSYLPLWVQATVKKISGLRGQHGRGRVQFPAIPEAFTTPATDPNTLNATGITAYSAAMGNMLTPIVATSGATYYAAICTRPKQTDPPGPLVYTRGVLVATSTVRPSLGSQLRRVPGRGI